MTHRETPEIVSLPEPGRSLLKRTYPLLVRRLGEVPGPVGWTVGGGTILAARWRHRQSKDLDIKVNPYPGWEFVSRLTNDPELRDDVMNEMADAGATEGALIADKQAVYYFGDPMDPRTPIVELFQAEPSLEEAPIPTLADGLEIWTRSTAEILAGKWAGRRLNMPVRDAFDWGVAGLKDGLAMQRAMATAASAPELDAVVEMLETAHTRMQAESPDELWSVAPEFETLHADPARAAALAIGRWAVQEVRVVSHEGQWEVRTRCKAVPDLVVLTTQDLDRAVREARALGGWEREKGTEVRHEAMETGSASADGGGMGMTAVTAPTLTVDGRGQVQIQDFARETTLAPSIAMAADIAISEGIEREPAREALIEQLEAMQAKALELERGISR